MLLEGQNVLVIGGGLVGERKTLQLLDAGAKVMVASKDFTKNLLDLGEQDKVNLERADIGKGFIIGLKFHPKVVIVATNDKYLNTVMAKESISIGSLVSVVDDPSISDFAMPAVAKVGDFRIGVSTRGSSPAMAAVIRRRVEEMITEKDLRQLELQKYARSLAKKYISSSEERGKVLVNIIGNNEINVCLERGDMNKARELAMNLVIQMKEKAEVS